MATARTRTKAKAAPAPEPEEVEDDLELEELEEDDTEEEVTPKAKTKAAKKTDDVVFGASDLAKWLNENVEGAKVDARGIRTLIRKMARDGSGRVNREIVPGNRTRYNWSGPTDPEVKAIIKAFKAGELEADKQEKLAALKENKAKKDAAAPPAKKAGTKKAKPAPVVEEEDDDEELDLDDDE